MKRARGVVLAIALTAALGAAWVAKKIVSGPCEVETVEKTVGATDVLVAANNINLGDSVQAQDLIHPRGETPRPGERRDTVWGKYIAGNSTGSKWTPGGQPLPERAVASEVQASAE
jgi:hypothetical protein